MAPALLPQLLTLAALACAPPGAAALRSRRWQLQCIVPSDVAAKGPLSKNSRRVATPPECSSWPQRLASYTGTEALPLNRTWWKGGVADIFRPNQSDFARALRPLGYAGARLRLRRFLLDLVAGKPVEVSVLGGSMPYGQLASRPWPALLEDHMRTLGHEMTVHNLAVPGASSEYAATHIVYAAPEVNRSSLVILDTSINDWADWWYQTRQGRGSTDSYDLLVQELLALPHRPAVIELATLHMRGANHDLNQYTGARAFCSETLSDFPHARAEAFQLPIVSFPDAMCQCCGHEGLWFGERHPNTTTHDAIARTLVASFGMEMAEACEPTGLQVADHPPMQELRAAPFSECLRFRKTMDVDFTIFGSSGEAAGYAKEHDGWQFARDLPTKPFGWLLPPDSPPNQTISLYASASSGGWIRLDYLSTYERIGPITCWVDGIESDQGCFVDPLQRGRYSAVRSAYIGLPSGLGASLLHCRSHGGKFKVLGISAC